MQIDKGRREGPHPGPAERRRAWQTPRVIEESAAARTKNSDSGAFSDTGYQAPVS
jgi:hypothetical protein